MNSIKRRIIMMGAFAKGFIRKITSTFPINCPDSVDNDSLINMSIEGNSYQDGEPTYDNPIEIQSVGEKTANMLVYPYLETTKTINGVTFTDNGDGTITANGIANATTSFPLATIKGITDITQKYYLTGAPIGGSYYICIMVYYYYNNKYVGEQYDKGDGLLIELSSLGYEVDEIRFYVRVGNGRTVDNLVFKPMIQAYDSLNNLLSYPYVHTTKTHNGVTFTDNGDGTITANGTAEGGNAVFQFTNGGVGNRTLIKSGTYILSGNPSSNRMYVYIYADNEVTSSSQIVSVINNNSKTFTLDDDMYYYAYISIASGETINNATIRPCITKVGDYEPYGYKVPIVAETENLFTEGVAVPAFWTAYMGGVGVSTYGGNVIDISKIHNVFKANRTYTLSYDMKCIAKCSEGTQRNKLYGLSMYNITSAKHDLNGLYTGDFQLNETKHISVTATLPENFDECTARLTDYTGRYVGDDGTTQVGYDTILFTNIKIEEADHETEPIVSNVYLKEPLSGVKKDFLIGAKDIIDIKDGICTRNLKEGIVSITSASTVSTGRAVGLMTTSSIGKIGEKDAGIISEKAVQVKYNATKYEGSMYENPTNICFVGSTDDTLETLKAKYDGSKIVYVLAEPITEKIIAPNIPTFKNGTTYSIATTVQPLSGTVEYYSTTKGE